MSQDEAKNAKRLIRWLMYCAGAGAVIVAVVAFGGLLWVARHV